MTKLFCQLYYLCLSFLIFADAPSFLESRSASPIYISFAYPLSWLTLSPSILFPLALLLTAICLFLTIFFPNRFLRSSTSLLCLIYFSMSYSFGKINHTHHIWLISCLFIPFLNTKKTYSSTQNTFILRLMQSLLLCPYLFSGLWKMRGGLWTDDISLVAVEQMTYSLLEGNPILPWVYEFFLLKYIKLSGLGLFIILAFQISTIFPILRQKYFKYWGLMGIVFHLVTGVVMGIWFTKTILGLALLLIWVDFVFEYEAQQTKITS